MQPSFATGIVRLGGQITGLSSAPESRAKVDLKGRVDEYSPVDVSGEVNVLSAALYTKLALNFRNIELTAFNPYAGKFAGYNIAKGKLSTEMSYHVEQGKLDAKHHITVDNLEFGDKTDSKDAASIPIKLGVALLKDRRGVIEVDLPVSGTLDDPEFHLGSIIWKSMRDRARERDPRAVRGARLPVRQRGRPRVRGVPAGLRRARRRGNQEAGHARQRPGRAARAAPERAAHRCDGRGQRRDGEAGVGRARAACRSRGGRPTRPPSASASRRSRAPIARSSRPRLRIPPTRKSAEDPSLDAKIGWLQAALLEHLKPAPAALEALGKQRAGAVRDALLANKDAESGTGLHRGEAGGGRVSARARCAWK